MPSNHDSKLRMICLPSTTKHLCGSYLTKCFWVCSSQEKNSKRGLSLHVKAIWPPKGWRISLSPIIFFLRLMKRPQQWLNLLKTFFSPERSLFFKQNRIWIRVKMRNSLQSAISIPETEKSGRVNLFEIIFFLRSLKPPQRCFNGWQTIPSERSPVLFVKCTLRSRQKAKLRQSDISMLNW